ncbi:Gfo/Idh/MocA family oxidoreductase [Microbacterium sp. NPDC076895]|uniref:Gfo/Idh/MocA family protein n=1 Tax=Microbacterium sp. NPDC076895 TaxID=3154957 RepID=UPI0034372CDA
MTNANTPIRVAVIGTSVISASFAEAVAAATGIRIEAVYSRDADRAAEAATEFGADWSSDSLDEVLGSPLIDAVYIASPNSVHAEQVAAAITAGKHVLVEKPAVLTAQEWRDLVAQAQDAGVVLLEAMRTEYDPGTALVRSLLPQLGTLRLASLRYAKRSSRYDLVLAGERVNMFDPALGGGALADLGVYCLHAMVGYFGMLDRLSTAVVPVPSGVEGAGTITASYPGLIVDLSYSKISTTQLASEIQGEDATLVIDEIAAPRVVELTHRDGTVTRHEVPGDPHPLAGEIDRFVALIAAGEDPSAEQLLTAQTLELIERARATTT